MHLLISRVRHNEVKAVIAQRIAIRESVVVGGRDGERFAPVLDGKGNDGSRPTYIRSTELKTSMESTDNDRKGRGSLPASALLVPVVQSSADCAPSDFAAD